MRSYSGLAFVEVKTLHADKLMRHLWIRFIFAALRSLKSDLQNDVIINVVCNMEKEWSNCEA